MKVTSSRARSVSSGTDNDGCARVEGRNAKVYV